MLLIFSIKAGGKVFSIPTRIPIFIIFSIWVKGLFWRAKRQAQARAGGRVVGFCLNVYQFGVERGGGSFLASDGDDPFSKLPDALRRTTTKSSSAAGWPALASPFPRKGWRESRSVRYHLCD
jgi:hypothetical protein